MFLLASAKHLGNLQGRYVPTVIATQALEPALVAIVSDPVSAEGWSLATRKIDATLKVNLEYKHFARFKLTLTTVDLPESNHSCIRRVPSTWHFAWLPLPYEYIYCTRRSQHLAPN